MEKSMASRVISPHLGLLSPTQNCRGGGNGIPLSSCLGNSTMQASKLAMITVPLRPLLSKTLTLNPLPRHHNCFRRLPFPFLVRAKAHLAEDIQAPPVTSSDDKGSFPFLRLQHFFSFSIQILFICPLFVLL